MRLIAKPVDFLRVFLAESMPPGVVEEIGDSIHTDSPCITLEVRDIQEALLTSPFELITQMDPGLGLVRYFMHVSEARKLCCHLIHSLANTDDRVAQRLEETLFIAMQELQPSDEGPELFHD